MSHIENITNKTKSDTTEEAQKEGYAPLSKTETAIDTLKRWIPFGSTEDAETITKERVNSFEANQGPSFLDQLTEKTISEMAIEQLLFLMWMAVMMDLQETNRVSQKTLQFIRELEENKMKDVEESFTSMYMYMSSAAHVGSGFAGDVYGGGLKGIGQVAGSLEQQQGQIARMGKELASQMKQEQLQELQQLVRGEEKALQMIEQAKQLRTSSFQR